MYWSVVHVVGRHRPLPNHSVPARHPGRGRLLDRTLWPILQRPASVSFAQQRQVCVHPAPRVSPSHFAPAAFSSPLVVGRIKPLLVVSSLVRNLRMTGRRSATVTAEKVPAQTATLINVGRVVTRLLYSDWCFHPVSLNGCHCVFPGMFSYQMNDRFFLVPSHSQERCTVCKIPKACHPHTECDPALVRWDCSRIVLNKWV